MFDTIHPYHFRHKTPDSTGLTMDTQYKIQNGKNGNFSYQNTAPEPTDLSDKRQKSQLELERDLLLEEFRTDRDAIMLAIKDYMKSGDYASAQEFIYKYRAAAASDEEFAILAKVVAQKLETERDVRKAAAVYEATAEEDTDTRIALCQKILRMDPDNQKYRNELEKCRMIASGELAPGDDGETGSTYTTRHDKSRILLISVVAAGFFILLVLAFAYGIL